MLGNLLLYTSRGYYDYDWHFYSANSHVNMIKGALYIKYTVLRRRLPNYIHNHDYFSNCDITFLTVFILTHHVNFPCGRKPEHPEKTHDFRQRACWLTLFTWVRCENRTHELRGESACPDDSYSGVMCVPAYNAQLRLQLKLSFLSVKVYKCCFVPFL